MNAFTEALALWRSTPQYHGVAELVVNGHSQSLKFFAPTRTRRVAEWKLKLYTLWHREADVVTRIVDSERAEFLLISYTEWLLRRQIDAATPPNC